jgi:hypothetical protein
MALDFSRFPNFNDNNIKTFHWTQCELSMDEKQRLKAGHILFVRSRYVLVRALFKIHMLCG